MHIARSTPRATNYSYSFLTILVIGSLLAIALRGYFITAAIVFQPLDDARSSIDAAEYYRRAWNMLHHGVLSIDIPSQAAPAASSFRDPGYPLFLALWLAVATDYQNWYAAVLVAQAVLGGVTVACVVIAFRHEIPTWALAKVALLAAAWPHSVTIASCILSENLTAPLVAGSLLALRRSVESPTRSRALLAGLMLACAGLTNAVLAPMTIVLALVLHKKRYMTLGPLAVLSLAALLPLMTWG